VQDRVLAVEEVADEDAVEEDDVHDDDRSQALKMFKRSVTRLGKISPIGRLSTYMLF
jgi:hypothetical protein